MVESGGALCECASKEMLLVHFGEGKKKSYFILNLKGKKPAKVLQHWAQWVQSLEEETPKNKTKAKGENSLTAANLRAIKASSPPRLPVLRERPTTTRLTGTDPGNGRKYPRLKNSFVEVVLGK